MLALVLAGCSDEPARSEADADIEVMGSVDGGMPDAREPRNANRGDAQAAACVLPPDCKSVTAPPFFAVEACCSEKVECGFAVPPPSDLNSAAVQRTVDPDGEFPDGCVPRERYFLTFEGLMDERVPVEGSDDILIAESCRSSAILSIFFAGCCLPENKCGISTYQIHDTIAVLVGADAPLAQLQCASVEQMNELVAMTSLAGFAHLKPTEGSCDHAALDARLPPVDDPLTE